MDKFWERYITSRPAPGESKGAFEAFAAANRDPGPRTMAQEPRNMYAGGQLVRNTVDGSRPGYGGKDKISFKDQLRTSGGTYKKMYSMEEIRKLGKELNVSEYNKKTGIKLTSDEYRDGVNKAKSRFNFYKNQFDSFSSKKKKAYIIDFNKQLVKHKEGGYYISSEKRMPNAKFVKKYFPNATGGSKIVTSINGMLLKNFVNKGNVIKTSPKADANAIRIEELRKITNPTWETSTGVQGTKGSTLQHVASKNQMVTLSNLSYLEKKLNASLSQNDKRIKIIENEVDRLLKTKPKNYVQRINALNTEGMALASGYIKKDGKIVKGPTAGYSEFRVKDPLNEKLSYFGKDESKMLLLDKDPHLIQKDSDLIGKNIKDMNAEELKRAKQIAIDKQKILSGWCSKGTQKVKEGGRIGFGGCPDSEKITNMKNAAAKLKQHKLYLMGRATTTSFASEAEARALASKMAKSGGLLRRAGRLAIGPMTLWGEPLFEGAFVAHDILGTGTPWKEAVAKSLWAKPAIAMGLLKPADQQYDEALWQVQNEEGEALLKEDQTMAAPGAPMELRTRTGVKRFIDNNKKIDKLNDLFALKQSAHISGRRQRSKDEIARDKAARDKNYRDYLESLGGAEGVTKIKAQIENDREAYDTRVAAVEIERQGWDDPEYKPLYKHERLEEPTKEMQDLMYQKYGKEWAGPSVGKKGTPGEFKDKWIIDPKISEYEKKIWDETKTDLKEVLKEYGDKHGYGWTPYGFGYGMEQRYTQPGIGDRKYNEDLGYRQLLNNMYQSQASGGRAGYMGGGMTGIRKPGAIAPTGGPMHQGLRSLYIDDMDY